jgi:Flp pilus assembly CpaF family ATPase
LRGRRRSYVIERIVAPLGLRVDATSPWVDARLPDGSRVQTDFLNNPFLTRLSTRQTGSLTAR